MRLNPLGEVEYRLRLAKGHLRDAREAYTRGDFRSVVESSQLVAENSAKSVVAFYRVPSWSHDPSSELNELLESMPAELRELASRLASIAHELAPEHARAVYGEPVRGLTPWDIYTEKDAVEALRLAEESLEIAIEVVERLKGR